MKENPVAENCNVFIQLFLPSFPCWQELCSALVAKGSYADPRLESGTIQDAHRLVDEQLLEEMRSHEELVSRNTFAAQISVASLSIQIRIA